MLDTLRIPKIWIIISFSTVVALVAYGFISFMIAQGVTKANRGSQVANPSEFDLEFENVEFFPRYEDLVLRGWYLPVDLKSPTLIFVHGIGSVRSGNNAVELASRLVERDFNVLLFDLRGHGSSDGDKASGGYFERWDVLGAFDYLLELGIDSHRIGLIGFSMGASASILAAADEPRINAVAVDSAFADASDLIAREAARATPFPSWLTPLFIPASNLIAKSIYGIDIGSLVPERAVSQLDFPVLVIHGIADQRVPWEQGQRVSDAAKEGSVMWLLPEVGHVDSFLEQPDEYVVKVSEYFDERLR